MLSFVLSCLCLSVCLFVCLFVALFRGEGGVRVVALSVYVFVGL